MKSVAISGATIVVDAELPQAAYGQLVDQIVAAIGSGTIAPGARLPSVRALAEELGWPRTRWPRPIDSWSRRVTSRRAVATVPLCSRQAEMDSPSMSTDLWRLPGLAASMSTSSSAWSAGPGDGTSGRLA